MTSIRQTLGRMVAEAEAAGVKPRRLTISDDAAWELANEIAASHVLTTPTTAESVYLNIKEGRTRFHDLPIAVAG